MDEYDRERTEVRKKTDRIKDEKINVIELWVLDIVRW